MAFTNMQVEAPRSEGGKMPERMVVSRKVVSKEEERVSGCEARKDGTAPLFCSSEGGVTIRTTLVSKAAHPEPHRGGHRQLPVLWLCKKEDLDSELPLFGLVPSILCPWSLEVSCLGGTAF